MLEKNLSRLYQYYDAFLIDMYGVLYDGQDFFPGVLNLLEKIKGEGKKILILSNTTIVSAQCKEKYLKKGLTEGVHYDIFISSGEAFKQTLKSHIPSAKTYFQAFHPNDAIFADSDLIEGDSIEKADFIYVGNLNSKRYFIADRLKNKFGQIIPLEDISSMDCHDIQDFEEITSVLDACLKYNKPIVIANPDLFALEAISDGNSLAKRPVLCQGIIGEFYEKMGGKVLYFGKPYPAIYDFAKSFVPQNNKIAMIGDTIWTDILGGNIAGVDTILALTGVSGEFIKNFDKSLNLDEKLDYLLKNISAKMTHKNLSSYSQIPTHIVEKFAD